MWELPTGTCYMVLDELSTQSASCNRRAAEKYWKPSLMIRGRSLCLFSWVVNTFKNREDFYFWTNISSRPGFCAFAPEQLSPCCSLHLELNSDLFSPSRSHVSAKRGLEQPLRAQSGLHGLSLHRQYNYNKVDSLCWDPRDPTYLTRCHVLVIQPRILRPGSHVAKLQCKTFSFLLKTFSHFLTLQPHALLYFIKIL